MMTPRQRWTILLVSIGGALETFDFVIYGFFAHEIGREFFPANVGMSADTLSYAVLAIGNLSRPIGGISLGRLGDKYGRRSVFTVSAMVASVSTLLIGMLPSYRAWGMTAAVTLLLLRLTQGFCVGGELSGAVVYAVEITRENRGVLCGMVFFAVNMALLLAAGINLTVQMVLTPDQVSSVGWRIGFLLGGVIGLLSFVLRRTLMETNEYVQTVGARHKEPLAVLFRGHLKPLATGIAATVLVGASNGLFVAHMPTYLRQLGYDPQRIAMAQTLYVIVVSACILVTARMGDVLPRRYVFRLGAVLSALFGPVFYVTVARHQASLPVLFVLFVMAGMVASFANGTFACAIAELFPVGVRFSGVGTAMNLGLAASIGTAPLIANVLVTRTHWPPAPALFMMLCATFAFMASFGMKDTRGAVGAL
ncbi:MFS transporter [Caballeronia sp. SEWSISQ10-4 2]|uniref:MFS transporter n=1 Tax=Caballeronia sp. SEWSISQ10-4 2 TaxID=2937438 RepID=UPI00264F3D86|nr:MFS transporter [Caballeronia sp. SEWSISQ10-4 2]MDN7182500.1 MFS transporter [Caballeronia sp. SEWSISQ10-4 2]